MSLLLVSACYLAGWLHPFIYFVSMKRFQLVYASIVINKMFCDEMSRGSVDLQRAPRRKSCLELVDSSSMKQSLEMLTIL